MDKVWQRAILAPKEYLIKRNLNLENKTAGERK
jgi:hypothetical protein